MSENVFTLDDVRKLREKLRGCSIKPNVVESEDQAKYMTEHDICGHVWSVGEEYYVRMIPSLGEHHGLQR